MLRLALACLVCAPAAAQAPHYVDASAPGGGDGSAASPFRTIQEAVDVATPGDEIRIATGTYAPFTSTVPIDLVGVGTVIVEASLDPNLVGSTIQALGINSPPPIVVDSILFAAQSGTSPSFGLHIETRGDVSVRASSFLGHHYPDGLGGGLLIGGNAVRVEDCVFRGNAASTGGGLYATNVGPLISAQTMTVQVERCTFEDNRLLDSTMVTTEGAAAWVFLALTQYQFVDCVFRRNDLSTLIADGIGNTWVSHCTFEFNGGLREDHLIDDVLTDSGLYAPYLRSCTLIGPVDGGLPSGSMACLNGTPMRNCTVIGNPSGRRTGFYAGDGDLIDRTTLFGYDAGNSALFTAASPLRTRIDRCTTMSTRAPVGGYFSGEFWMTDSIVANHEGPMNVVSSDSDVSYSNFPGGGAIGIDNIDADPLLYAPLGGDARLGLGSPCIDTGTGSETDPDGSPRDMGAIPRDLAQLPPEPATYCPGSVTSEGSVPEASAAHGPSLAGGIGMDVDVTGLPTGSFGLFFLSPSGLSPFQATTAPHVCTGQPSVRSQVFAAQGTGPSGGTIHAMLTATEFAWAGFLPGDHVHLQCIARDPANPNGLGVAVSNALEVLIED